MPASKPLDDTEVAVNQAALRHAETYNAGRSVLLSMIGSEYSDDEAATNEEGDEEAFEGFGDDSGGVGYIQAPTQKGLPLQTREANAATEKLRKQMLGKRARFQPPRGDRPPNVATSKQRPQPAKRKDDSEDEQEGRSGLGKKRISISARQTPVTVETERFGMQQSEKGGGEVSRAESRATPAPSIKKRGGSYLDQVLAERVAKKKKKRKADK